MSNGYVIRHQGPRDEVVEVDFKTHRRLPVAPEQTHAVTHGQFVRSEQLRTRGIDGQVTLALFENLDWKPVGWLGFENHSLCMDITSLGITTDEFRRSTERAFERIGILKPYVNVFGLNSHLVEVLVHSDKFEFNRDAMHEAYNHAADQRSNGAPFARG